MYVCFWCGIMNIYLYLIQGPFTWNLLQLRSGMNGALDSGIYYDDKGYKLQVAYLSDPAYVSLLLNTDGVSLYCSSKVSIWPV